MDNKEAETVYYIVANILIIYMVCTIWFGFIVNQNIVLKSMHLFS